MMTTTGLLTRTLLLGSLLAPALAIAEESEKTPRWNEALIEAAQAVTLGPRPLFLVNDMSAGNAHEQALKASLLSCAAEQPPGTARRCR